jgi:hypothetical protein
MYSILSGRRRLVHDLLAWESKKSLGSLDDLADVYTYVCCIAKDCQMALPLGHKGRTKRSRLCHDTRRREDERSLQGLKEHLMCPVLNGLHLFTFWSYRFIINNQHKFSNVSRFGQPCPVRHCPLSHHQDSNPRQRPGPCARASSPRACLCEPPKPSASCPCYR